MVSQGGGPRKPEGDYERHARGARRLVTMRDEADEEHTPVPSPPSLQWLAEHARRVEDRQNRKISDVRQLLGDQARTIAETGSFVESIEQSVERIEKELAEERREAKASFRWFVGIVVASTMTIAGSSIGSCIQQREDIAKIKGAVEMMQREGRR